MIYGKKKQTQTERATTMKAYVGTYAKYNEGNLAGAWLSLDDFSDKDDFMEAALALHKDEADPEIMFQDFDGVPARLCSETHIDKSVWEILSSGLDLEAVEAYCSIFGEFDADDFQDRYQGKWQTMKEFAENFVEDTGMLSGVDECIARYFDYESFARDLGYDYNLESGHLFHTS
jgi:antirestriction protein